MSFAGAAAGGSGISSMFWNSGADHSRPGRYDHRQFARSFNPRQCGNARAAGFDAHCSGRRQRQYRTGALLPASYGAYRLSNGVVIGASLNSPFGLVTQPDNVDLGRPYAGRTSSIKTFNLNVVAGIQLGNGLSVGIGPQVQLIKGRLTSSFNAPGTQVAILEADDIAVGATAGVHWQAEPRDFDWSRLPLAVVASSRGRSYGYPRSWGCECRCRRCAARYRDILIRHALSQKLTACWHVSNGRIGAKLQRLRVECTAVGGACPAVGAVVQNSSLAWKDGWMVALGGEYAYSVY